MAEGQKDRQDVEETDEGRAEAETADDSDFPEAPAVDFETFDLGWNRAIERAAETAAAAVQLSGGESADKAGLIKQLVLGLKRGGTQLHEPEAPFTHSLRADK